MWKVAFDSATAVFAAIAAFFWYLSASGDIPALTTYWGAMPASAPFVDAMQEAARMNMIGASFAALSAFSAAGSAVLGATSANAGPLRFLAAVPGISAIVPAYWSWPRATIRERVVARAASNPAFESGDTLKHWHGVARFAAKDDPLNADAWVVLGQREYALSRYEASRSAYTAAVQLRRNPATLIGLGDACVACRDTAGAVAAFQATLEIDPANAPALARLGREYAHAGNDQDAVPLFERAIQLFDDDKDSAAWVLVDLALSQLRLGMPDAGIDALLRSVHVDGGEMFDTLFPQIAEAFTRSPNSAAQLRDRLARTHAALASKFFGHFERNVEPA